MCQRPLPELLARFFAFYAESFAWGSEVVSIRTGRWRGDGFGLLSKRRLWTADPEYAHLPGKHVSRLHVEDPFLPRNLNCVLNPENEDGDETVCASFYCVEEFFKQRMQEAYLVLQQSGVPQAFLQAGTRLFTVG